MKRIGITLFTGLVMAISSANGQEVDGSAGYYKDALLLGQTNGIIGNTARMQGLAGAQVSLGADMSTAAVNPAGLGFFNRSVFSLSPSLGFQNSTSSYFGSDISTFKNTFNLPNFGMVFHGQNEDFSDSEFKGGSFAVTFSKLNNFNSETYYSGRNTDNSITDSFVEIANAELPDAYTDLAHAQFLIENADGYLYENWIDGRTYIYPDGDFDGYTSLVGKGSYDGYLPRQSEQILKSGGQNALNFAWGGNYGDKIYFGAGMSYISVNYSEKRTYTEDSFQDTNGDPDNLLQKIQIKDQLDIYGSGIGFNLGMIVRPVNFITVGVSYQSPKFYTLQSESSFDFITEWNTNYSYYDGKDGNGDSIFYDLGNYLDPSEVIYTNYNLKTPSRVNAGATVFLGKNGFITGDIEMIDYGSGQLKSGDFITVSDNQSIKNLYNSTLNYRLGAEYRIENMRIRAGYAYFGDPYKNNPDFDGSSNAVTLGAGYRSQSYFVDFALVNQSAHNAYKPYSIGVDQPVVKIENRATNFTATVGFNF